MVAAVLVSTILFAVVAASIVKPVSPDSDERTAAVKSRPVGGVHGVPGNGSLEQYSNSSDPMSPAVT